MRVRAVFGWVAAVAGLAVAGSAHAQGALAEEIWSENFCEQAVSLARQRGELPEALDRIYCRALKDYQPSYWQCVIAAMKADARTTLAVARQRCLAGY